MNLFGKFFCVTTLVLAFSTVAFGQLATQTPQEIKQVKKDIEAVKKELQQKQKTQRETVQVLQRTKETLQKSQRELMQLNAKHKEAGAKLQKLRQELELLSSQIQTKQAQLARLLFLQNKRPHQDALVVLLKNENPNQKGRDLTYLRYVAQANQKVVGELKTQQQELAVNEVQVNEQLAAIKKVMLEKQTVLKQLKGKNTQALNEHNKITQSIDTETKKLDKLRSNEQQLAQLTKQLARKSQTEKKQAKTAQSSPATQEREEGIAPEDAQIAEVSVASFRQAKGRLRQPTSGAITGRFGTKLEDGSSWKGIFISSGSGQSVSSVYAGKVIYTGQVGSFGNTIIVDHGDNYVSVYMGLSGFGVGVNSNVKAGQRIGSTGQNDSGQSGLYFQIRHLGQPVNPSAWLG